MHKQTYQQNEYGPLSDREKQKFTWKDIVVIILAWLMALSLVYLCYLKFSIFLHH